MVALPTIVFAAHCVVVTLKNGDHLTGTVSRLDRGQLHFSATEG
jgi:hypothetical protein